LSESYLLKEIHLAACLAARFTSPISSYRTRSFIDWMGQFLAITPSISVSADASVSYTLHHPALGIYPRRLESSLPTSKRADSKYSNVGLFSFLKLIDFLILI
jgi:hypothetical protein